MSTIKINLSNSVKNEKLQYIIRCIIITLACFVAQYILIWFGGLDIPQNGKPESLAVIITCIIISNIIILANMYFIDINLLGALLSIVVIYVCVVEYCHLVLFIVSLNIFVYNVVKIEKSDDNINIRALYIQGYTCLVYCLSMYFAMKANNLQPAMSQEEMFALCTITAFFGIYPLVHKKIDYIIN